jgi:hypothetical protein
MQDGGGLQFAIYFFQIAKQFSLVHAVNYMGAGEAGKVKRLSKCSAAAIAASKIFATSRSRRNAAAFIGNKVGE